MTRDPRDTLVVTGGRPVDHVDAAGIRAAALRAADAAGLVRAAVGDCLGARTDLDRLRWTPPLGEPDPALPARVGWARTLVADAVAALAARADHCTSLSDRLLVAAGLYEDAESLVEQVVGVLVTGVSGALGLTATTLVSSPAVGLPGLVVLWGGARVLDGLRGDPDTPVEPPAPPPPATVPTGDGGLPGDLLRLLAPYADDAVHGAGTGVALAVPLLAGGAAGATGGARVLSTVVETILPDREVHVEEIPATGLADHRPTWSTTPPDTVPETLARVADLYPAGSGVPDRDVPGVPPGTIAVQRIEHADGPATWSVSVPGTQALVSTTHPFDLPTDLALMAGRTADVMLGVMAALDDAGARPDEPVVLAGHSLGGIAVTALAAHPTFRARHPVAGVVTAGAPTATFTTPRGVPVLHVENTEELVSPLDGRSADQNPATGDRVTLTRDLAASHDPADRAASGSVTTAHQIGTHVRTLRLAQEAGNVQVADVSDRIEDHLDGESATTRYYRVRRSRPSDD